MFDAIERKENERVLVLDKAKYTIKAEDPYGFWVIKFSAGKIPAVLTGHYTSVDEAEKALTNYLTQKGTTVGA